MSQNEIHSKPKIESKKSNLTEESHAEEEIKQDAGIDVEGNDEKKSIASEKSKISRAERSSESKSRPESRTLNRMKNLEFRARKMLRQQVVIKATKPRVRRKMKRRVLQTKRKSTPLKNPQKKIRLVARKGRRKLQNKITAL